MILFHNATSFVITLLLSLLLFGCSTAQHVADEQEFLSEFEPPVRSIIFLIHGDANYIYHDADGNALHADEETLSQAQSVASQLYDAEVFIFHQRSQRRFLRVWPRDDGTLYHYYRGHRLTELTYRREVRGHGLKSEIALYQGRKHEIRSPSSEDFLRSVFLYYGHEIPADHGAGYHRSYPEAAFHITHLAEALPGFAPDGSATPFDLTVLSTCNNGSPGVVKALAPHTRYLLASPQNLHLSYIDSTPLLLLNATPTSLSAFVNMFAETAFDRLSRTTQTVVTLSLFDTPRVHPPEPASTDLPTLGDYIDCAEVLTISSDAKQGVDVWYRPSRFGREAKKETHSGWGCRAR